MHPATLAAVGSLTGTAGHIQAFLVLLVASALIVCAIRLLIGRSSGDLKKGANHLGVAIIATVIVAMALGLAAWSGILGGVVKSLFA